MGQITAPQILAPATGFANGSANAPSIYLANSPATGLYRIGANQLGITANAVNQMSIATGILVGAPNGGYQGNGSLNVETLFIQGLPFQLGANDSGGVGFRMWRTPN